MKKFTQTILAKEAIDREYGFSPALKDIIVVGGTDNGREIECKIRGHKYFIYTSPTDEGEYLSVNSTVIKEL